MMKRISTFAFVLWLGVLSCALGCASTFAAVGRSSAASEATAISEAHACCRFAQAARRDNAAMHEVGGLPAHRAMEYCCAGGSCKMQGACCDCCKGGECQMGSACCSSKKQ